MTQRTWRDMPITDQMLLNVKCSKCGRKRGEWCVYLPITSVDRYHSSPAVIEKEKRVGSPTKKCHNERYGTVRRQLWRFQFVDKPKPVRPPSREVRETLSIFREYDHREREELKAWLRQWGQILL